MQNQNMQEINDLKIQYKQAIQQKKNSVVHTNP